MNKEQQIQSMQSSQNKWKTEVSLLNKPYLCIQTSLDYSNFFFSHELWKGKKKPQQKQEFYWQCLYCKCSFSHDIIAILSTTTILGLIVSQSAANLERTAQQGKIGDKNIAITSGHQYS